MRGMEGKALWVGTCGQVAWLKGSGEQGDTEAAGSSLRGYMIGDP